MAKLEEVLGRVERSRQRLTKVPVLLKRFRQSALAAACSGRLTADWREENPATEPYQTDIAETEDEFPAAWRPTKLGSLTTLVTSGSRGWAEYYAESGSIFIRAQNINADVLNLEDIAFVSLPKKAEGLRTRVQQNDILVTITGANVTKSALVDKPIDEAYVSQHVALVRLKDAQLSRFIFYSVIGPAHGRKQLLASAYGQGKPGLNLDNIRDVVIGLPPLAEQQEIVRRVEALFALADRLEARFARVRAQVDRLTPALFAKAFRGELVPQDPADEPAVALLERIRAGKNKSEGGKRALITPSPFEVQRYFIQLVPALLRAANRPLGLNQLNAAVALLFLPDQLLPLVEDTCGARARKHFETFAQTNASGALLAAIQFLARAGTLTHEVAGADIFLHFQPAKAPPITPQIETDAKYLAAIIDLIPAAVVKTKLREFQPRQVREALLTM